MALPRRLLGCLLDRVRVEHLEAEGVGEALRARLHAAVPRGHARDEEPCADTVIAGEQPFRVRHQDAAAAVPVAGTHLNDCPAGCTGSVVGPQKKIYLLRFRDRVGRPPSPGALGRASREGDLASATAACSGNRGRRLCGARKTGLAQVRGMREAGSSPR